MRRRSLIAGIVAATAMPLTARAQRTLPVIGFLSTAYANLSAPLVQAFRKGLGEAGFEEGRNVTIEYRWAEGRHERLAEMASDLVARNVAVIAATGGSPAPLAAKAASSRIPIVFQVGVDPVEIGLVEHLNRPGGNITGSTMLAVDLEPKRLELLREMVPRARTMVAVVNPENPVRNSRDSKLAAAAQLLGLELTWLLAANAQQMEAAFEKLSRTPPDALVIASDPLFNSHGARLGALALQHRLPAVYQFRPFVTSGGLMSYGGSITDAYRIAGKYTGRVLKGERPGELPVQQSTRFEFFLNLKTAKALGIEVPFIMIARADEVIE